MSFHECFCFNFKIIFSVNSFSMSTFGKKFKIQNKLTAEDISKYSRIKGRDIGTGKVEKV